jgi:uncharacterized protein (DUF2267 family)
MISAFSHYTPAVNSRLATPLAAPPQRLAQPIPDFGKWVNKASVTNTDIINFYTEVSTILDKSESSQHSSQGIETQPTCTAPNEPEKKETTRLNDYLDSVRKDGTFANEPTLEHFIKLRSDRILIVKPSGVVELISRYGHQEELAIHEKLPENIKKLWEVKEA